MDKDPPSRDRHDLNSVKKKPKGLGLWRDSNGNIGVVNYSVRSNQGPVSVFLQTETSVEWNHRNLSCRRYLIGNSSDRRSLIKGPDWPCFVRRPIHSVPDTYVNARHGCVSSWLPR